MTTQAMRTADGYPVFARSDGAYSFTFPREHIVRRCDDPKSQYKVYGFVGSHTDYEQQSWTFNDEDTAVEYATEIYGDGHQDFTRDGEVFEVEVHEVSLSEE